MVPGFEQSHCTQLTYTIVQLTMDKYLAQWQISGQVHHHYCLSGCVIKTMLLLTSFGMQRAVYLSVLFLLIYLKYFYVAIKASKATHD